MCMVINIFFTAISFEDPVEPVTGTAPEDVKENSVRFTLDGFSLLDVGFYSVGGK